MDELVIELPAEVGSQRVVVGPLVVGGRYGHAFQCAGQLPCAIGPLAPGAYKLQFPLLLRPERCRFKRRF